MIELEGIVFEVQTCASLNLVSAKERGCVPRPSVLRMKSPPWEGILSPGDYFIAFPFDWYRLSYKKYSIGGGDLFWAARHENLPREDN